MENEIECIGLEGALVYHEYLVDSPEYKTTLCINEEQVKNAEEKGKIGVLWKYDLTTDIRDNDGIRVTSFERTVCDLIAINRNLDIVEQALSDYVDIVGKELGIEEIVAEAKKLEKIYDVPILETLNNVLERI